MRIWKIISGILSIALSFFAIFQSCAAGFVNAVTASGEMSGTVGVLVALLMLTGGIVAIASRDAISSAGNISLIVLYGVATFAGYFGAGIFKNLVVFSTWCLLCAVMAAMAIAADNFCGAPVYIIIVVLGVAITGFGFAMNLGDADSGSHSSRSDGASQQTGKDADSPESGTDGKEADSQEANSESQSSNKSEVTGAGDLGDYHVEIKGASIAEDYDGNPAIIITYAWTNNSDETKSAAFSVYGKAFQDGVQLDSAFIVGNDEYDSESSTRDVRPGTTVDVQTAFTLTSETSIVEFELSELISLSNEIVGMNFDPASLG